MRLLPAITTVILLGIGAYAAWDLGPLVWAIVTGQGPR
jgi:hypothetical protein